ncbi:hypothetical protein Dda_3675 [Drechslerella dactyloides]|uniref:Uncharacterized protein n=1 Tax=Drechslerella dactyloides TaxID=74499 RepID=A0AAD6NK50_DREDA|nr:hypothetical protein Dda_3675 [Drechslerella dactyloides]
MPRDDNPWIRHVKAPPRKGYVWWGGTYVADYNLVRPGEPGFPPLVGFPQRPPDADPPPPDCEPYVNSPSVGPDDFSTYETTLEYIENDPNFPPPIHEPPSPSPPMEIDPDPHPNYYGDYWEMVRERGYLEGEDYVPFVYSHKARHLYGGPARHVRITNESYRDTPRPEYSCWQSFWNFCVQLHFCNCICPL